MEAQLLPAMVKTVSTVADWVYRVVRFTGMSVPEAGHYANEFIARGVHYPHTIGVGGGRSQVLLVNKNITVNALRSTRLIRGEETASKLAIPTGHFGDFEAPSMVADAINSQGRVSYTGNEHMWQLYARIVDVMVDDDSKNTIWTHRANGQQLALYKEWVMHGLVDVHQPPTLEAAGRYHCTGNTGGMFSHMCGPWDAAQCDFTRSYGTTDPIELELAFAHIENEYGVTRSNYERILSDGLEPLRDPAKYGIKKKSPVAIRAALAIHEILTTGETSFIFWTDLNGSGPQIYGLNTGCESLARSNGIIYAGGPMSTYEEVAKIVGCYGVPSGLQPYVEDLVDKKTGKTILVPVFYTATAKTAMRGLIFKKGKGDDITLLDQAKMYIPGSMDNVDPDILNSRYLHIREDLGWERWVEDALTLAKLYDMGLHELSPSLYAAMGILKESNKKCCANGKHLEIPAETGYTYRHRTLELDYETKDRSRINLYHDGRRYQCLMRPLKEEASGAGATAAFARVKDASLQTYQINRFESEGVDFAGKHDASGVPLGYLGFAGDGYRDGMINHLDHNSLNKISEAHDLGKKPFTPFSKKRLQKMQHHCD
jgi:hypothetical protein